MRGTAIGVPVERMGDRAIGDLRGRLSLVRDAMADDSTVPSPHSMAAAHAMQAHYLLRQIEGLEHRTATGRPADGVALERVRHGLAQMERAIHGIRRPTLDRLRQLEGGPAKAAGDVVSGFVRDEQFNPLPGVTVQLLDLDKRLVAQGLTGFDGSYTITVRANTALSCDYHPGPSVPIPALGQAQPSVVTIGGNVGGKLIDVGVQVAIEHGFPYDLQMTLRRNAPAMQQVMFANLNNFSMSGGLDVFFHDDGLPAFLLSDTQWRDGAIVQPPTAPLRSLAPNWFNSQPSNNGISATGTWELRLNDAQIADVPGVLEAWNLFLCQGFDAQQPYYLRTDSPDSLPGGPYVDELFGNKPCEPGCDFSGAQTLSGLASFSERNFELSAGARLSGRVTQAGTTPAQPLDGVTISVFNAAAEPVRTTLTDTLGDWSVGGLPGGQYFVLATADTVGGNGNYLDRVYSGLACEFGCDPTEGTAITLTPGQVRNAVDLRLAVGSFIAGRVSDELTGDPVAFAQVTVYDRFGDFLESSTAGPDGLYRTRFGYPAGQYRVATTGVPFPYENELFDDLQCDPCSNQHLGTPVVIGNALAPATADFMLSRIDARGAISGQIRNRDNQAIPGIQVEVMEFDGATAIPRQMILSDTAGNFTAANLPAGRYFVRTAGIPFGTSTYLDVLYDGDNADGVPCAYSEGQLRCPTTGGVPVIVDPPNTSSIIIRLDAAASISGVVTRDERAAGLGGVEVRVLGAAGMVVNHAVTSSLPGEEGRFTVGGLRPGRYYVATRNNQGKVDEIYRSGGNGASCAGSGDYDCGFANATPVMLLPGEQKPNIDFDLANGGYISGAVFDEDTNPPLPLENIEVEVYDTAGRLVTSTFTNSAGVYSTLTNSNGGYISPSRCPLPCDPGYRQGTGLAGAQYRLVAREHGEFRSRKVYVDEVFHDSQQVYCPSLLSRRIDRIAPACAISAGSTRQVQPPGGPSGVDFRLRRGGIVKGRLWSDVNASEDDRDPAFPVATWSPFQISRSEVELLDASGRLVGRASGVSEYEIGGLPEGPQYRVRAVSDFGRGEAWRATGNTACAYLRCATNLGDLFGVFWGLAPQEADFRNFDFERGGRIQGVVTRTNDGRPLAGATVTLHRDDGTVESTTTTDVSGRYVFKGMPAGVRYVSAQRAGYSGQVFPQLDCEDDCDARDGNPFEIQAGEEFLSDERNVDFALRLTRIIHKDDFED